MLEAEAITGVSTLEKNLDSTIKLDDLARVKEISVKLQLSIKRRSVLQWKMIIEEKRRKGLLGAKLSELAESPPNCNNGLLDASATPNADVNAQQHVTSSQEASVSTSSSDLNRDRLSSPAKTELNIVSKSDQLESFEKVGTQNNRDCSESERCRKITELLINVRKELILMKMEDHALARKLLNIREDMNRERAALICAEHAQLLDCVSWEIEEEKELDEKHKLSDLSGALLRRPDSLLSSPSFFRSMRINKTTFDFKRFSVI